VDNLKADILTGGSAVPGQAVPGGALLNAAMTVTGILRAPANAAIGLFDI
jgi:hypothetical protein